MAQMRLVELLSVVVFWSAVVLQFQQAASFRIFGRPSFSFPKGTKVGGNCMVSKKPVLLVKAFSNNARGNEVKGTLLNESEVDELLLTDEGEEMFDESNQEFLMGEFTKLSGGKEELGKAHFFKWDEIQQLVEDELVSKEMMEQLWTRYASIKQTINAEDFLAINNDIDDLLEEFNEEFNEEDDEDESENGMATESSPLPTKSVLSSNSLKKMTDKIEPTVWLPEIKSETLYEKDFLLELSNTFAKLTEGSASGQLTFNSFQSWEHCTQLTEEENLNKNILQTLWKEAVEYQYLSEELNEKDVLNMTIDLDTFYRLCYRLDDMMHELQAILKEMTDEDVESFYRSEFAELTKGEKFLTYDKLLQWSFLQETLKMNPESFSIGELKDIWDAFPKKLNALGESAIDERDFLVLNEAIDDAVMSFDMPASPDFDHEVRNVLQ
jgi:hypothetical protein